MTSDLSAQNRLLIPGAMDTLIQPLPCGWLAVFDLAHPEKPRQIRPTADGSSCRVFQRRSNLIHVSDVVLIVSDEDGARIVLSAKALEGGSLGQIIRCRSSLDGAIFLARVIDSGTLSLVRNERKISW
jgi:hypothetical protein